MKLAVTGGATGIGAAVLDILSEQGHELTVFDIREPAQTAITYIPLDLNDSASIARAVSASGEGFDGLCHIAGIPPREGNELACLTINATNGFAFLEAMMGKLNKGAPVVSVASKAGFGWQDNQEQLDSLLAQTAESLPDWLETHQMNATLAYKVSKQAVIYWSQKMVAQHIGQHRFITISPAAVTTGILDDFVKAFGPAVQANLAKVGRAGTPEEVANVIAFALSDKASWLNGIDIIIDGGMGALNLGV